MKYDRLKSGVITTYITYLVQFLCFFFLTPVFIRLLGQSNYGVYQIALSIVSYIAIINFGIPHSYMRFFATEKAKGNRNGIKSLNGFYFLGMLFFSLLVLVLGFASTLCFDKAFSDTLTSDEINLCKQLVIMLSANSMISMFASAFEAYFLVFERFSLNKIVNCIQSTATIIVSVVLLLFGFSLANVIVVTILITFIKMVFVWVYSKKRLNLEVEINNESLSFFKAMCSYSFFIFINLISDQMNWSIDRFLLGSLCGTENTAVYGVASQFQNVYMQLMIAISAVFITRIYNVVSKNESGMNQTLSDLFIRIGRYQTMLAGIIIIGFATFGKHFILAWAGDGYENAYWIVLILLISSTPLYIQNVATEVQRAKYLHRFRAYLYLAMCAVNLVISVILIKGFNEIGAAIGTAIVLLFGDGLIINVYYRKKVGLDVVAFWKAIFHLMLPMLPAVIFSLFVFRFSKSESIISDIPLILLMICFYVIPVIAFGLNKEEKRAVKKALRGLKSI